MIELELGNAECGRNAIQGGTQAAWYCCLQNPGLYLCICVFVYLCICVFVSVYLYLQNRQAGCREAAWYCCLQSPGQVIRLLMVLLENMEDEECGRRQVVAWHCIAVACRILLKP